MKKILIIVICLLIITGCSKQELEENKIPDDTLMLELIKTTGCKNQATEYYQKKVKIEKYILYVWMKFISRKKIQSK